jgi:hypothetical protein
MATALCFDKPLFVWCGFTVVTFDTGLKMGKTGNRLATVQPRAQPLRYIASFRFRLCLSFLAYVSCYDA